MLSVRDFDDGIISAPGQDRGRLKVKRPCPVKIIIYRDSLSKKS